MEVHSAEVCEVFGCLPTAGDDHLARQVIYKGRGEYWLEGFGPGAVAFLARLAIEIAACVHREDRHVDVPKRIESIVRTAVNYCPRLESPAILLAVNPKARLPETNDPKTILAIHQLARLQVIKELVPFVTTIFREMVEYGLIKDSSRTFHDAYN